MKAFTIDQILRMRARHFATSTALLLFIALCVIEAYVLSVEFGRAEAATQAWLDSNKPRIEQALFLENTLAITGLLSETDSLNIGKQQQIVGVAVTDLNGQLVTTYGNAEMPSLDRSLLSTIIMFATGDLVVRVPLSFADKAQGNLLVRSTIDRQALFESAGLTLLLTLIVIAAVNLSARSLIEELKSRVTDPLSALISMIARPDAASKHLSGILLPESELRLASTELCQLLENYNLLMTKIREANAKERETSELAHKVMLATQVSHDIRSPLSALQMVLGVAKTLTVDERFLIEGAVKRIHSICQGLLNQSRLQSAEVAAGAFDVVITLNELILEKKVEYQFNSIDWNVQLDDRAILARGDAESFKTVISNLLNNAIESCRSKACISISVRQWGSAIQVQIKDNGKGIPPSILKKIGREPVTHGKPFGNGIGVYTSAQTLQSFGGTLTYLSEVNVGTTARVELKPYHGETLLSEIDLNQRHNLVVLDDDEMIATLWRMTAPSGTKIESFSTPRDFLKRFETAGFQADTLFLIDYDFENSEENGLEIIERLSLQDRAVLVTGRHDDDRLRSHARKSRIRVMSKDDIRPQRWS